MRQGSRIDRHFWPNSNTISALAAIVYIIINQKEGFIQHEILYVFTLKHNLLSVVEIITVYFCDHS